jgi:hypothetical protein
MVEREATEDGRSPDGERPVFQSVRPAVAEMVGWRRDRMASMISEGSMPCR